MKKKFYNIALNESGNGTLFRYLYSKNLFLFLIEHGKDLNSIKTPTSSNSENLKSAQVKIPTGPNLTPKS